MLAFRRLLEQRFSGSYTAGLPSYTDELHSRRDGLPSYRNGLYSYIGRLHSYKNGRHSVWFNIVSKYSYRAMTKPKDKFVALSGIA
jgi:hypothetical protein